MLLVYGSSRLSPTSFLCLPGPGSPLAVCAPLRRTPLIPCCFGWLWSRMVVLVPFCGLYGGHRHWHTFSLEQHRHSCPWAYAMSHSFHACDRSLNHSVCRWCLGSALYDPLASDPSLHGPICRSCLDVVLYDPLTGYILCHSDGHIDGLVSIISLKSCSFVFPDLTPIGH